jgi:uncharacterized protein (TIGR03790 family)
MMRVRQVHRMTQNFVWRLTLVATAAVAVFMTTPGLASAQSAENVAVVINDNSPDSQRVGQAYAAARSIPDSNVLHIRTSTEETVDRATFVQTIEVPLSAAIRRGQLHDRVLYIVLTKGVPLRVAGTPGPKGSLASVDSELTLLYRRMTGRATSPDGVVANPYFLGDRELGDVTPFTHHAFDIFLVSRLDGFTVDDVLSLIERGTSAQGAGRVVLDKRDAPVDRTGDAWLEVTAKRLASQGREGDVVLEQTSKPARGITNVLGYFSWGSTDPQNRVRSSGMTFAPGAIAGTFVGSGARTFREPSPIWRPTGDPVNRASWHAGSPESLIGDLIREGVTGVAGYVDQPLLNGTIRPQILFPAYFAGRSLVEAFYLATPHLSWQTVVVGDPLCAPFRRETLSRSEIESGLDSITELPGLFSKRRLEVATSLSPGVSEQAVALYLRAENLQSRGDATAARQAADDAIQRAPQFVPPLILRAGIDESAGRHEEAWAAYRQVLEVDANNVIALNNLAYGLAEYKKMPKEALPLARRAVAAEPNNAAVMDTLAWIQHLMGDSGEAAKLMEAVVRTNVPNPAIRLHAAIIFAEVGQRSAAQTQLAAALKMNPSLAGSAEVKQLQAQLAKASR